MGQFVYGLCNDTVTWGRWYRMMWPVGNEWERMGIEMAVAWFKTDHCIFPGVTEETDS